jgi:hypothetical protein
MGVTGPLAGLVVRSSSSRLDYRVPTMTVLHDMDSRATDVVLDADPRITYIPQVIRIAGRTYRIWVDEKHWTSLLQPANSQGALLEAQDDWENFLVEVTLTLIDADPADCRACQL